MPHWCVSFPSDIAYSNDGIVRGESLTLADGWIRPSGLCR